METFAITTKIWFGEKALQGLTTINNQKIFVVADPFLTESDGIKEIVKHLEGNQYLIFDDIIPDPPIDKIIAGITAMNDFQANKIIAVGGGSAIDAAKAMKYFNNKIADNQVDCFIAIPTTSGTGSEVTNFSVITIPQTATKYPLVTDEIQPDIAILDTDLVMGVPPKVTADTGMDVLTHIIEAYVSTKATIFSDAYCEKAIKLVFDYLETAYCEGENREARSMMHLASCLAGIAFNQASLGINHSIAHATGAKLHVPHGRMNTILMPAVIACNSQLAATGALENSAAKKYQQLANLLGAETNNPRVGVNYLIRKIVKLRKALDMPATLSEFGIEKEQVSSLIPEIAEAALVDGCTATNPRQPTISDLQEIIKEIL
ncbi:1-propanol dehydrogenase [Enterococcus sp. PF1-24]|uniref:1-propanol dehydrogenase PduQ n=1 Tax=unclassified Enterococcus TaxID=2608891 RepID=UPI00247729F1|nr:MULTISPECIES: 1-propanol dehydrogenase PduQ [unclassified Enterococcus]MDH6363333.1 1-propanol dehydrogenase [Enterococcus sp. PFB1-1]MDH6400366.1 1-propanol dehydrogenase [Enterococcus sp. PF1-24]